MFPGGVPGSVEDGWVAPTNSFVGVLLTCATMRDSPANDPIGKFLDTGAGNLV